MEYITSLITAFGTPTVVIVLLSHYLWYIKQTESRLKEGDGKFNSLEKNMMIIGRSALRLEIVNDKLPLNERVRAYNQYTDEFHGNGYMHEYYEVEIKPLLKEEFKDKAPI